MDNSLITYLGIEDFEDLNNFEDFKSYKIEGSIIIDDEINDLLSFALSKECIDYNYIESFEECNFENLNIYGNLLVLNNEFKISFEYSSYNDTSRLNMISKTIYNSTYLSLENYSGENLDVNLTTLDLFCSTINSHEIFYCINMVVCINEL